MFQVAQWLASSIATSKVEDLNVVKVSWQIRDKVDKYKILIHFICIDTNILDFYSPTFSSGRRYYHKVERTT